MRRRSWVLVILVAGIAIDLILASIPGPAPTEQAIAKAEQDPIFLSVVTSRVINGTVVNGNYSYIGYSNDPARDFACINSLYHQWGHYFNPFHQYTTTTLLFAVEFRGTRPIYDSVYALELLNVFVQVNPATGQIYSIQQSPACL